MQVARGGVSGHTEGALIQAVSPLDHMPHPDNVSGSMSLTVSFFRKYKQMFPNANIVIIPAGKGGSAFYTGQWEPGGNVYNQLVLRVNNYFTSYPNSELKGLLWHQGGSDIFSSTYHIDLPTFFTNIENDISRYSESTPTILGLQNDQLLIGTSFRTNLDNIITNTMFSRNNTYVVTSKELSIKADGIHFDSEGIIGLGEMYFTGYLSILNNTQVKDFYEINDDKNAKYLTLISPNGTKYYITVNNSGVLSTSITIP